MNFISKFLRISILLFLFSTTSILSNAATYTAANGTSSAVQSAINLATDGDIVQVPSGTASWGAGGVSITKSITLKGATAWTSGTTTITLTGVNGLRVNTTSSGTTNPAIVVGFTFVDNSGGNATSCAMSIEGPVQLSLNTFNNCSTMIRIDGSSAYPQLINSNTVSIPSGNWMNIFGYNNAAWDYGTTYGTINSCYIEHNKITCASIGDGVFDAYGGAKFVFRYNLVTNGYWGWHGCDSTPYNSGDGWSPHSYEIYGNHVYYNNGGYYTIMNSRGGTGLVFSNTVSGRTDGGAAFIMQYFRYSNTSDIDGWGAMNGSNPWDGNTGSPPGYPGLCQQGRTGPTTGYGKTGSGSSTTQVLSPTYIWGNDSGYTVGADGNIQLNRDYYLSAAPGYTPLVDPHPWAGGIQSPGTNAPSITAQPVTQTVLTNITATFSVSIDSSTDPTNLVYQWSLGGTNIVGATDASWNYSTGIAGTNQVKVGITNVIGGVISDGTSYLQVTNGLPYGAPPGLFATVTNIWTSGRTMTLSIPSNVQSNVMCLVPLQYYLAAGTTVSSVTNSAGQIASVVNNGTFYSTTANMAVYIFTNPPASAHTVTITLAAAPTEAIPGAVLFSNCFGVASSSIQSMATSQITGNIAANSGQIAFGFDAVSENASPTPTLGSGQTLRIYKNFANGKEAMAVWTKTGGTGDANSLSWGTSDSHNWIGVTLQGSPYSTTNPPSITVQPSTQTVQTNSPATFSVTATGDGTLTYQWNWFGTNVTGATSSSWIVTPTSIGQSNSTVYVGITNAYGYAVSSNAYLYVTATNGPTNHTYYVSTTGNDSTGDGSIGNPWATLGHATANMVGGDVVYVRGGTYNVGSWDIYGPNGSNSTQQTLVINYPGETPIFYHGDITSGGESLNGLNWFTISGLRVVSNNIGMFVGYYSGCTNVTVTNMVVDHIGQQGLQVEHNSSNILVINNTVHDTGLWTYNGEGIYVGQGDSSGILDNTHNCIFSGNTIYNTKDEGIEVKGGTYNITVSSNILYTCNKAQDSYGAGGGAIEVDEEGTYNFYSNNPNHLIRNNIVYDTVIGIRAGTGGYYYNNIVYGCITDGILINDSGGGQVANSGYTRYVYNNTVASNPGVVGSSGTYIILNNIGYGGSYNLTTNVSYFVNMSGHDYRLVAGSAPIDAGTDLTSVVTNDFNGVSRPQGSAMDIGAYEYTSAVPPPTSLRILSRGVYSRGIW